MRNILPYLLIQPDKLRFAWYKVSVAAAIIVFVFISIRIGSGLKLQADFTVFWQAGINFSNNVGLYERIGGAERFIYPPFAAMLFQVFGQFSLQTAGAIWAFLNLLMWLMLVHIIRELFRFTKISEKEINRALIIAFVFSFRYFWYHLMFMQMNVLVLLLSMLGFLFFLRKNNTAAIACLVIATGIKVLPIVFLVWLLSKMHPKIWFKAIILALPILVLPIIWRGWQLGIQDLYDYYVSFLEPFQQGRVEPKLQNYALSAALYKWFVPLSVSSPYFSPIVRISADSITVIYKIILVLSVSSFIFILAYSRFVIKKISVHEISFLLLFTHLISGITWEYHLVSFLVVYAVYFSTEIRTKKRIQKIMDFLLLACMVFNAIVGMDTVGKQMYYMSCGYSFLTLLLLFLLIYSFGKIFFSNKMDFYFNQE